MDKTIEKHNTLLKIQLEQSKNAWEKTNEMFDILNPICPHCKNRHYFGLQFACKNGLLKNGVFNEL